MYKTREQALHALGEKVKNFAEETHRVFLAKEIEWQNNGMPYVPSANDIATALHQLIYNCKNSACASHQHLQVVIAQSTYSGEWYGHLQIILSTVSS